MVFIYSMAGALNKLPVAVSGMIFFNAPVTFFSVTAVLIGILFHDDILSELGFTAGLVYAFAKSVQSKQVKMVLPTTNSPALELSAINKSRRDTEQA
jgi:GDP-mannose transporter